MGPLHLPNIAVLPGPGQPTLLPDSSHAAIKSQHCPQTVPLRTRAASRHNILFHPSLCRMSGTPKSPGLHTPPFHLVALFYLPGSSSSKKVKPTRKS